MYKQSCIDRKLERVTTESIVKPTNYTKKQSNTPSSVLGSIVCGLSKRFAIVNDTEEKYRKRRQILFGDLINAGWKPYDIRHLDTKYHPAYKNRDEFISRYIHQYKQKMMSLKYGAMNSTINIFPERNTDDHVVVFKMGVFNKVFDRIDVIGNELECARVHLPERIKNIRFIVNHHASNSLASSFYKT